MEEKNNPFEALANIYKKSVAEADENGLADAFKKCTELVFEELRGEDGHNKSIHVSDVTYLDGYFIFGTGTNSVVHFHAEECPGWRFGIWWSGMDDTKRRVAGEFFAQYEDTIDKFKPSASAIAHKLNIDLEDRDGGHNHWEVRSVRKVMNFIADEPYVAFCRDYCGWDYNLEYHSREEAKAEFDAYKARKELNEYYEKKIADVALSFITENVLPLFIDAKIEDRGECWYPRYDVIAPFEANKDVYLSEPGCYYLFGDDPDEQQMKQQFEEAVNAVIEEASSHDVYLHRPVDTTITFYES